MLLFMYYIKKWDCKTNVQIRKRVTVRVHEKTGTTHRKGEQKYVRNSSEKKPEPMSDRWMDELDIYMIYIYILAVKIAQIISSKINAFVCRCR